MHRRLLLAMATLLALVAGTAAAAQTRPAAGAPGPSLFPPDVRFVVRLDARALVGSPLLEELLRRPEAAIGLARALTRPSTLSRLEAIYVGLPDTFTPETTELPVLVLGDFGDAELLEEIGAAPGVRRLPEEGRAFLEASGPLGTTIATVLGDGALAAGDDASVRRMVRAWDEGARGAPTGLPASDGSDLTGAGRVPSALLGYLQAAGGLGSPLAAVDRLTFTSSLGQAVSLSASLHAPTAEGRQALQQALGALVMFGPSRFANDPEVLSAIQSLRFTVGPETVDVSVTLPRSLLLRLL